jgi:toxin ParE1/3/4
VKYFVSYAPGYFDDLRTVGEWYERQRPGLGRQFLDRVDRAIDSIEAAAEAYPKVDQKTWICQLTPYAYGLYFEVVDEDVRILGVFHLHRKPGLWRQRRT